MRAHHPLRSPKHAHDPKRANQSSFAGGHRGGNFLFYEQVRATDFIRVEQQPGNQIPSAFAFAHQVYHAPCLHDSKVGALNPADGSQLKVRLCSRHWQYPILPDPRTPERCASLFSGRPSIKIMQGQTCRFFALELNFDNFG
ncbi:hypothetical protein V4C53_46685 [Paraburkholderia azotifigens]|uniref:hypothetical protein n=1 Tax=Paraburkholderia azotifigens TaxID=2057004 RepID=UPI0031818260